MAKQKKKKKQRAKTSLFTRILLLALLGGISWRLYTLQGQLAQAQENRDRLATLVEIQQQENDALSADIAQGGSQELMENIAREELGLVAPGEYVFYDVSN